MDDRILNSTPAKSKLRVFMVYPPVFLIGTLLAPGKFALTHSSSTSAGTPRTVPEAGGKASRHIRLEVRQAQTVKGASETAQVER